MGIDLNDLTIVLPTETNPVIYVIFKILPENVSLVM
jgi:hypothetical protein